MHIGTQGYYTDIYFIFIPQTTLAENGHINDTKQYPF